MRRHRILLVAGILLIILIAVGAAVYQKYGQPARTVLLLPDGNLMLYINVAPAPFVNLAQMTGAGKLADGSDPQYRDFLQQTDFQPQRDLDEIALSASGATNSDLAAIFSGRFDQGRLKSYLQRISTGKQSYAGRTVFSLSRQGEVWLACVVDSRTVALANREALMHAIVEKAESRGVAAPALLRDNYHDVPFASVAWAIARFVPDAAGQARAQGSMDFLDHTTSILSIRYFGSVRARAEVISSTEGDAARLKKAAEDFLAPRPAGVTRDDPVGWLTDHIRIRQKGTHTVFDVNIPSDVLRKLLHSYE